MIFRTPAYYSKFKCIASACSDNCCIGWEIDIDRISREKYERVSGSFGDRLRKGMVTSPDGSCSFALCQDRRCVFLNRENLCDLILNLGESSLCQICRDHPRYFSWFGDGSKEGGVGLCCEEAARIILGWKEPFSVVETEIDEAPAEGGAEDPEYDPECDALLIGFREEALELLDSGILLTEALIRILEKGCALQEAYDREATLLSGEEEPAPALDREQVRASLEDPLALREILERLLDLLEDTEPMMETWPDYLEQIRESLSVPALFSSERPPEGIETDLFLKNIAQYFIWRYTRKGSLEPDGFFLPYIVTPVLLTLLAEAMFEERIKREGTFQLEDGVEIIKAFSKEAEYDEEFFERLLGEACGIFGGEEIGY